MQLGAHKILFQMFMNIQIWK